MSSALVTVGLFGGLVIPSVRTTAEDLYAYYVGDIHHILYNASKPEVLKAYALGLKIVSLLGAWFVVLFAVELVIRLVIIVMVFVLRQVGVLPKAAASGGILVASSPSSSSSSAAASKPAPTVGSDGEIVDADE